MCQECASSDAKLNDLVSWTQAAGGAEQNYNKQTKAAAAERTQRSIEISVVMSKAVINRVAERGCRAALRNGSNPHEECGCHALRT